MGGKAVLGVFLYGNKYMMDITDINGLVCIDLWESNNDSLHGTEQYQNWLDELCSRLWTLDLQIIVNASFHTRIDFDDPSMLNTFKKHNWSQFDSDVMMSIVRDCNHFRVSQKIKQRVFGAHTFFYNKTQHFQQHVLATEPHINCWLVVGNTWPICTHRTEMGLGGFSQLIQDPKFAHCEFYGATWGFIKEDDTMCTASDFEQDTHVEWQQLTPQLFRLK